MPAREGGPLGDSKGVVDNRLLEKYCDASNAEEHGALA